MQIKLTPLLAGFVGFFAALGFALWGLATGDVFWVPLGLGFALALWGRPEAQKLHRLL